MVRGALVCMVIWLSLPSAASAQAPPDALDGHVEELNRLMRRSYESESDPKRRQRKVERGEYFSVDAARTRLQFGRRTQPQHLQIPFDAPWSAHSVPAKTTRRRARARLEVGGERMTAGRPGKPRRTVRAWRFHLASTADAARVAEVLLQVHRAANGRGAAPTPKAAPKAAKGSRPAGQRGSQQPPPAERSQARGRQPAFKTSVSPLNGTHTGEPIEISVQTTPDSWLTAFAENDGPRKMFQAVYIEAPDGRLVGGKKTMDAATGALRFGHIARTPTGRGGRFTIRIVPLRDSRGPFYFEGRVVHPTRESRPEQDLCDGLDLLMAHIDDGLGHLVETDPTKPGTKPVPLTLPGGIRGEAAAGHTWVARVFRGSQAEGRRRSKSLGRQLDGCLGAGRSGEVKRAGWADHEQRSWTRGDVHVRLRLYRKSGKGTLELAVYKGEGPL